MKLSDNQAAQVMSLNGSDGQWQLATDPQNVGREEQWWTAPRGDAKATKVPWIIQDAFPEYHGVVWYWRDFVSPAWQSSGRALLHFEAVDYIAEVWLNDTFVGAHEGGEGPFELDVTEAIRLDGDNRLAVRVLNPSNEIIDGIALLETPRRCKFIPYMAGAAFNHGGITAPVQLVLTSPVRVEDLWVRADPQSGVIRIEANLRNAAQATSANVEFSVAPALNGETLQIASLQRDLPSGDTLIQSELSVENPLLWQLNEPNLYRVSCRVRVENEGGDWMDERSTRCGFRDFRFENGYFRLNGKRLFLRGTHTLNHTPVGLQVPHDPDLLRRDLLHLKVMGFNMVRFIWGGAVPYQLDLCDEIGLMVYNESYAAYPFAQTPHMTERFDRSLGEIIRRDRNHPSVVIWGLLNEVHDNALFQHALASLPFVRALDDTRMVMSNSGRWDKRLHEGSFSNPNSLSWDVMLGREGQSVATLDGVNPNGIAPVIEPPSPAAHGADEISPTEEDADALKGVSHTMSEDDAPPTVANLSHGHESQAAVAASGGFATDWATIPGYVMDMGDVHPYPRVPQMPVGTELLRRLGEGSGRVLLSEYGIGSAVDLWRVTRHYERMGATHAEDAVFYRDKLDRYLRDWQQWHLDEIFIGPQEFFAHSLKKMAGQRTLGLNAIRSNPNLAGYSLTGAIDHVMCGEGLTTLFRELKPGTVDAVTEGFAPLRLCLFAEPPHIYRGANLRLEAVLANEDSLGAGEYRVRLQVVGPQMERVWERTVTVTVPARDGDNEAPLAIPFFNEKVMIDGSPGQYRFVATFEEGAAPTGGEVEFHVSDAAQMPIVENEITLWGEDAQLSQWLGDHGIATRAFSDSPPNEREVILVSHSPHGAGEAAEFRELVRRIARGATAIFLSPSVFARDDDALFWLPLENKGEPTSIYGWLYNKDEWVKRHPIFDGLPCGGLMDYSFYRDLIPDAVWSGQDAPAEAVVGAIKASQDYSSGLMLSVYELGAGRFILNTLHIGENLGRHPAAEHLLRNLLRFGARDVVLPPVELASDFDQTVLQRVYRPQPFTPLKRQWQVVAASPDEPPIGEVGLPDASLQWQDMEADSVSFVNFTKLNDFSPGLVYARGEIEVPVAMDVDLSLGPDGPCKVWIDDGLIGQVEMAFNPGYPDKAMFPATLCAGRHVVTVALTRRGRQAEGFFLRFKRTDENYSAEELQSARAMLPIVDP